MVQTSRFIPSNRDQSRPQSITPHQDFFSNRYISFIQDINVIEFSNLLLEWLCKFELFLPDIITVAFAGYWNRNLESKSYSFKNEFLETRYF